MCYVLSRPLQSNSLSSNVLWLTTDPASDESPAWSPDGRYIAFQRVVSATRLGVFLVGAIGGAERKLAEISKCEALNWYPCEALAWHPDGRWLAVPDRESAETPCSLYALSVETGEKRRLTVPPPGSIASDLTPAFSPDGRGLAFARGRYTVTGYELFVLALREDLSVKRDPRQITFKKQASMNPSWTPDGREIVFSSLRGAAVREMWRLPLSNPAAQHQMVIAGEQGWRPALSRQGNRLAYVRARPDLNILRLELTGPNRTATGKVNFISSTVVDESAQYSPDGRKIVLTTARSGSLEVWVCAADGSNPGQLTSMGAVMTGAPRWSPEGQEVVFHSAAEDDFDVYVINASGGRPRRLTTDQRSDDAVASWSSDGKVIYFVSNRTGRREVWKMPAQGGEAVQVTRNGGYVAFESPDGEYLYFSKSSWATSLRRVPCQAR